MKALINIHLGLSQQNPIFPIEKGLCNNRDPKKFMSLYEKYNEATFLIKDRLNILQKKIKKLP